MKTRDLSWLTAEIAETQAYHRQRLADLFNGIPPKTQIAIDGQAFGHAHGLAGTHPIDMLQNPQAWLDDVLEDMRGQSDTLADRATFRPAIIELDPWGVHYIDQFFGANVYFYAGQVWNDELKYDLSELAPPDVVHSPLFQQSLELGQIVSSATQAKVLVAGPVLSCPANIAINLFGQRFLEALLERPALAQRTLRIITDVIITLTRAWKDRIPPEIHRNFVSLNRCTPPGFGEIDGCATQLISGAHYRQYFAPLDEEILRVSAQGGLIHICGSHQQHISTWAQMKALRAIQLNDRAADDLALFYAQTRPDQTLYVTPHEHLTIAQILEITHGHRTILQASLS